MLRFAAVHATATASLLDQRHVIGAILFDEHGHRDDLERGGVDRAHWGGVFADQIGATASHEADYWRGVRDRAFPAANAEQQTGGIEISLSATGIVLPPLETNADLPHFTTDRVGEVVRPSADQLGASGPARLIAKLFTAKAVTPPIAVGLFGNWGSGKSFFMGLIKHHVEELTRDTAGGVYVGRAVQIDFNAWHYQDTNLWAGLAMRIFEVLSAGLPFTRDEDNSPEGKRRRLHAELESSKAAKQEAENRQRAALQSRAKAEKTLEEKLAERLDARSRFAAVWLVARGEELRPAREALDRLARDFGIAGYRDASKARLRDAQLLKADLDRAHHQAFGLIDAVAQRFSGVPRSAQTIGWVILLVLAALSFGPVVDALADFLEPRFSLARWLPDFKGTFTQITTFVTLVLGWCGARVKQFQSAVTTIDAMNEKLAEAERTRQNEQLEPLRNDVARLDFEIRQATEQLSAADDEIAKLTAQIDRIDRGGLVYDFLQQRRSDASYVGQLGLISTIRRDLGELETLLRTLKVDPIERIILYVDDLDRCEPDKVVEILQAVHLLLAIDLFHVVVGVDPRWLERALRRKYVVKSASGRRADSEDFDPNDYLEKIFQIPFALRQLDEDGFKKLVDMEIKTRTEAETERRKQAELAVQTNTRLQPPGEPQTSEPTQPSGVVGSAEVPGASPSAGTTAADPAPPPLSKERESAALVVEDFEQEFLKGLAAFVERPRLAKRLLNLYRLARLTAAERELAEFSGNANAVGYRAAATLLALIVRHPEVAGCIIRDLAACPNDLGLDAFLARFEAAPIGVQWSARHRAEAAAVRSKARSIGGAPQAVGDYKAWAHLVARFSYHWSATPALSHVIPEAASAPPNKSAPSTTTAP